MATTFTVVGVTADVVTSQMSTDRPQIFVPMAQHQTSSVILIARASVAASEASMAASFSAKWCRSDFAPSSMSTGDKLVRRSVVDRRRTRWPWSAPVCLDARRAGVCGVVGFMVATRTRGSAWMVGRFRLGSCGPLAAIKSSRQASASA
jgi:hypothetical protein